MGNTTFTIPEGFEIKQINENQFEIVKKDDTLDQNNTLGDMSYIREEQMRNLILERGKSLISNYDDENNGLIDNNQGDIFSENNFFNNNNDAPKLNDYEMDLLRFCHNTDMHKFLKENVGDKPIDYSKITGEFDGLSYYGLR